MSNKVKIKCLGKDRNNDCCRNNPLDNTRFCKLHDYMCEYSDYMLNNLLLCSGCKKMHHLIDTKTCIKCKKRGEVIRLKDKQEKILCKKEECKYEKSDENEYCGKHQADYFKEQTELENKKVCYNYTRGCREKLDLTYKYSKCQPCLEKDRIKDKARYNANKEINLIKEVEEVKEVDIKQLKKSKIEENIDNIVEAIFDIDKIILEQEEDIKNEYNKYKIKKIKLEDSDKEVPVFLCSNKYHWKQGKEFIDDGKCYRICNGCRAKGRINDKSEHRQEYKKEWKDKNYDKYASYWMNYRARKIDENVKLYLENNANSMKAWRDKNPEKVKEIYKKKKNNIKLLLNTYKLSASAKNLEFDLTDEEFYELVKQNCYYCNELQEKGFNGIDRIDCTKSYTKDNSVSSCTICNFIKGSLDEKIFIKTIEHILTYQGLIKGKLYPELFVNHKGIYYLDYKKRAIKKKLDFEITKEDFDKLTKLDCYICGKKYCDNHKNGLDRINNNLGYTLDNIESCCGECNYMKREYKLHTFFDKLIKIKHNKLVHLKNINTELKCNDILLKANIDLDIEIYENENEYEDLINNLEYDSDNNTLSSNDSDIIFDNKTNSKITKHLNKKTSEQIQEDIKLRKNKIIESHKENYLNEHNLKERINRIKEAYENKKNNK